MGVQLGHDGADVGFDLYGTFQIEVGQQLYGIARQRAEFSAGRVVPPVEAMKKDHHADRQHPQGQGADEIMRSQDVPVAAANPMPAADQDHGQVKHHHHDHHEVGHAGEGDHAAAEIGKPFADAPLFDDFGPAGGKNGVGHHGEHQRCIESGAQNEPDREVAGQERSHHADGQHRQPDQPVAHVSSQEQPHVELALAEPRQHAEVADQREQQRHGVDAHRGQVLAQHDVEVARREGQEQLVGSLPAFLGPDAHGDGRDEDQHDEREPEVELVEIGQVGTEELVGPERRQGTQKHEHADKHVARRIGKVTDKVAFENR